MTAPSPAAAGEVVRIRPSFATAVVRPVAGCLVIGFNAVLLTRPAVRADLGTGWVVLGAVSCCVVLVALLLELSRPEGVDLRPDAVVIHGRFRSRTVEWRDVAGVRVDRSGLAVVLERTDGWRLELGYPRRDLLALNRRRFDAHHRRISEWWLAHRDNG